MILVTGAAGFIGFHTAKALLERGERVLGVDNLNAYYDVRLKEARLRQLSAYEMFTFKRVDLSHKEDVATLFNGDFYQHVIHLAAQAGVRYSLTNPHAYIESNITGFLNILEGCRRNRPEHLVFASSSSVYGGNTRIPFSVRDNVDHPVSLYAATKKANELMAHSYAHLYGVPSTGLRFFTVYGPWGRPDMAIFIFTEAILNNQPIQVFNFGKMQRDFTYIDDIVQGIIRVMDNPATNDSSWNSESPEPHKSSAPFRLYNIGNNNPVELLYMIELLEKTLGRGARKQMMPLQAGDVPATYADIEDLCKDIAFRPLTSIETGIERFVQWYRHYYHVPS